MIETLCALAFIAWLVPGCAAGDPPAAANGYVEGEYVLMGPRESGRIKTLDVAEGQVVKAGARLFTMDPAQAERDRDEAHARLDQAKAQLADLTTGERNEEIAVREAAVAAEEATLAEAERNLLRQQDLFDRRVVSRAVLDEATARRDTARARLDQARKSVDVARMPARSEAIEAARRNVTAAEAALAKAEWRLGELTVIAPGDALVDRIVRRVGEMAGPEQAVVSLLPPQNRKVRFFVPESERMRFAPGVRVLVGCDGCPLGLTATVTRLANEAEFTPPVIYSLDRRQKLVFAVEARPDEAAGLALNPGQPVDIRIAP
jgi:HlyD family secretion protein